MNRRKAMRTLNIFAIVAILATTCVVTSASACPIGYVRCGSACCPAG
jgi:hypothetical protein